MAVPNVAELTTTTIRHRSRSLADNVSANNALLFRLKSKKHVKPFSGGRTILEEIDFQENGSFLYYSGYEQLNTSITDVLSAAEFNIRQAAVTVSMSGLEEIQNSSREQMIDLLDARITNAERTMANNLSEGVYSDGTGSSGKQINGLQALIADAPATGTVGGIDRATWTFWRNYAYDATTDGGAAATSSNIRTYMNTVWLNVCRGTDKPDLMPADNNYFSLYWASLQDLQRFMKSDMAEAGFQSLKFNTADVVFDGGYGGDAPTDHMYFCNTDYIRLRPHSKRNMVPLDGKRFSMNQDAFTKIIVFAGNLTLSNGFTQGVLKD